MLDHGPARHLGGPGRVEQKDASTMTPLSGKVALVTGAARGQGRAHAERLADEGADIVAGDICGQIPGVPYAMATEDDLETTAANVRARGRRIATYVQDVRDLGGLKRAVSRGVEELG